ncbi:MAG: hypothetical protein HRU25_03180 [Psychrobium sp.]|nr:hypothetical protein [Psychrobium sp.]
MLNNIGLYGSLANTNVASNQNTVTNVEKLTAVPELSLDKKIEGVGENLSLSSRSQKLAAISKEFFSHGNFSNVDSRELLERVREYDLISAEEYDSLSSSSLFQRSKEDDNKQTTLTTNLADALNDLEKSVVFEDEKNLTQSEFKQALNNAENILRDVETAKLDSNFNRDIDYSLLKLKQFSQSKSFVEMPAKQQSVISDSVTALEVINKISPKRLSNPLLNRYLSFAS